VAETENVFDTVRDNRKRIEEIENFVRGDPSWNQPGLLTLLKSIQTKQQQQEWKLTLLLSVTVFLLLLSLILSTLLVLHLQSGL
jgi:antibiotic biosynthesis monooxygenase (ABM) superfamily enzyme